MKLACSLRRTTGTRLADLVPALQAAGFDAVEVDWSQLANKSLEQIPDSPQRHRDTENSLWSSLCLCVSVVNLESVTQTIERSHYTIGSLDQQIDSALRLPACYLAINADNRQEQSMDALVDLLESMLPRFEAARIDLCIANANGSRLEHMEDIRELLMRVQHGRLKLLVDTGEFHAAAVNPRDAIREFPDRIHAVRLSDRRGKVPAQFGAGDVNFHAALKQLRLYNVPWLSIEVLMEKNLAQVLQEIMATVQHMGRES